MSKKLWSLFSLLLILSMMLSACAKTTVAPTEKATGPSGEVTLWHAYSTGSTEETTILELKTSAEAAFPNMKINILQIPFDQLPPKYQQEVAAGGGPDMFVFPNDDLGNWVRGGMVLDITDKLAGKLDKVSTPAIDGMKVDGKMYGVPESAKAVALYYNKELVPTPPTTTDELMQMVKDGAKMQNFVGAYHMFGWAGSFGGKLFDASNKCVADQSGWAEALQYLLDLKAAGAVFETDYAKAETPFRQGEAAFFVNGPWALGDYKKDLGDKLGVIAIPAGPGGTAAPLNGIDGFYINPNSKNIDGALELALFLVSKASSQTYTDKAGHVPVRSDVTSADPLIAAFAAASATGFPRPQSVEFANFWTPFGDLFTKVLEGALAPADGVAEACKAMNAANSK